jgi:hypothetical protein
MFQNRVHIDSVPKDDDIHDESECAELVFLTFPVVLSEFASLAMENSPRQAMPFLAAIQLG